MILGILAMMAVLAWLLAQRECCRENQLAWLVMAALLVIVFILSVVAPAGASGASPVPTVKADVRIPELSQRYRRAVEHASAEQFGLKASPARLAAQLHAESGWRHDARSPYAEGLAQFVPATAAWLPQVCPALGPFDPWNPLQSIDAAACYNRWLLDRQDGATECDRWAFTLSAYNGGDGWVRRDKRRASAAGADPARWFGHVDAHSGRAGWAIKENRTYVVRILLQYEPAYIRAGWLGSAVCP